MDKKQKYIEYISEQLLEGTLYDIKTNTFQLSVIKELDDTPVSFSFSIGFVERFSGEKSTYRTFPQIMMMYISLVVKHNAVNFNPGVCLKLTFLLIDAYADLTGDPLSAQKPPKCC